jgi:hypothetical protein
MAKFKKILTGKVNDFDVQDSGMAVIQQFDSGFGNNEGLFVRLQSWSETPNDAGKPFAFCHADFEKLIGKKVRISIEEI